MPFIGYAVNQLPTWLTASAIQRRTLPIGLPTTADNDQLSEYVAAATALYQIEHGKPLSLGIMADGRLASVQVISLIKLLQKQGINRYNLVTNMEPDL
ncbi:hypothetical protein [Hymenobacter metallicola]|nr:hypothetical protein [Hymenobacter metallicola]